MVRSLLLTVGCVCLAVAILAPQPARGQDAPAAALTPEQAARAAARAAKANPGGEAAKPAEAKPAEGEKPKEGEKPAGDKPKEGETKEPAIPIITRPDKFDGKSTADKIQDQIGTDGLVHFNLQGIPWPDVLQWLADASKLSLDWQKLPGDFLNLRTQHGYSIEEARDVINRHLLARGFTMLKQGESLTVLYLKEPNPGLVPRVTPDELDDRMPHEFVKVSFPLDWMLAKDAVEELKPMLSSNGQLTALSATNRLEAMDAVINLREIRTLLKEEQTGTGQEILVRQFKLQYVRAAEILPLVQKVVGIDDPGSVKGNIDSGASQQIMQKLQQLEQMQQQAQRNQGQPGGGAGGKSGDEQKPKLIINERENSIVAHAPPDKMEIIRQTITALDTPSRRSGHLLANPLNLKVHRLSTLDPAPLVSILNELGDLSPDTKIEVDNTNKSLIVYGPLADQVTVQTLVDKLDGSTRNFEVIQLRRLRAEDVAGTILYMLSAEPEDKKKNNSGSYYYSYYESRYSNYASQQEEEKRPFRVDADIEGNRLFLWANEVERTEVMDLLAKMGEIPSGTQNNETLRVLEFSNDQEAQQMLDRIRGLWPSVAPNKLDINIQPGTQDKNEAPAGEQPVEPTAATTQTEVHPIALTAGPESESDRRVPAPSFDLIAFLDQTEQSSADEQHAEDSADTDEELAEQFVPKQDSRVRPAAHRPEEPPPPVTIQRGPDGRLIVGSADTRALDQLEDLLATLTPKRRDYVIFKLKNPNTWAFDVEFNLKAFFEQDDTGDSFRDWYGDIVDTKDKSPSRLSKRKPLKIIGDEVSRTVLVQGATADQLKTIADLIEIYDKPQADNPQMVRVTQTFTVKYSDAHVVAEAVKEAFRDLLSPNDPAFEKKNGEDRNQSGAYTVTYDYGSRYGNNKDDEAPDRPEPIRFKGALSMGVDEVSNTIVVSAARGLLADIGELIKELDELAKASNNVRVVPVHPSINLSTLQERMAPVLHVSRPGKNGKKGDQNGEQGDNNGGNGNNGQSNNGQIIRP